MNLSTIACQEITGEVTGPWTCELQRAPLLSPCLHSLQHVWFRDGKFHWMNFWHPRLPNIGELSTFMEAVSQFESETHPELTRVGPTPRRNQLNIVVFVSVSESTELSQLLLTAGIEKEDSVIAPQATLKLSKAARAAA